MKTITTVFLILLVSLQMMAGKVIKIQDIEYAPSWMTIKEVELTKDATIISGTLEPGASILNNTVLVDRNTGKEYKFWQMTLLNSRKFHALIILILNIFIIFADGIRA